MGDETAAIDWKALAAWMDVRGLGVGPIEHATPLAGGTQNIIFRFSRAGRDYVLRRPPAHPRPESNETMRREARVLTALAGSEVPHPALIAACDDEAVLGAAFYLMDPVDGFNPVGDLPQPHAGSPAMRHRMGLAMVEALAALGSIDPVAAGLEGFGKPQGYLERQVARWMAQLRGYEALAGWPGAAALGDVGGIADWLEANRPKGGAPGILHGDFHLANVMFRRDSGELAAVVDWELATIGDPLVDLGWLLATWPEPADEEATVRVVPWEGFPAATELVARYAARSSRDLSAIGWYAVFACWKLAILLEGTHARAHAGKAPMDTGQKLHRRARHLIARAQRWIDGERIAA